MTTTPFTESAITLTFPDKNFFRFENCDGYKSLKGNYLKEMDFCWLDESSGVLFLIELKDWATANLTDNNFSEKRIWDLVKKSVDSICMLVAAIHNKPYASQLLPCIPFDIKKITEIKMISIIHCEEKHKAFISSVSSEYKTRFAAYAKLFDIKTFTVLTHDIAIKKYNWIK